jgi:hypothetical protein
MIQDDPFQQDASVIPWYSGFISPKGRINPQGHYHGYEFDYGSSSDARLSVSSLGHVRVKQSISQMIYTGTLVKDLLINHEEELTRAEKR